LIFIPTTGCYPPSQALAPFLKTLKALAVESTYNWYWLVDGLMDAGVDVRLVNTAAVPQYAGLKHGNDHPMRGILPICCG